MKHIKNFESIKITPEIGDFVKISTDINNQKLIDFLDDNIGKITSVDNNYIEVEYNNIPKDMSYMFFINRIYFSTSEIIGVGKTLKELELNINTNKYNL